MIHYLSFFLLPVLLFAENKLHDEDPKGRPHHALSYGVSGSVAIYDGTVFVSDRTIDSHIRNIRAKFRAIDDGVDLIGTVQGLGYKLKI